MFWRRGGQVVEHALTQSGHEKPRPAPTSLLERLASQAATNTAPSESIVREQEPSAATATLIKPRRVSATFRISPVSAVITKIDRMKTSEELAEHLGASGYDIPASEMEAGMNLHLPCLVKLGQGNSGYKVIKEFLPEAA